MIDVLVAGGGPAGLAAAIEARLAGFAEVVVVEPQAGVIDKACGEGLMPGALSDLARLGVDRLPGRPFAGIRYLDAGGRQAVADFGAGPGQGVRRLALHEALRARAAALGVAWCPGRVGAIDGRAEHVRADVGGAPLRARWLLVADGLRSRLRDQLGLSQPPRRPPRYGVRRHYAHAPWSDRVDVHLAAGAEAYVTPVAADLVGVAILTQGAPRGRFDDRLARDFPALAARLGEPVTAPRGAGPFEQRVRRRVQGRVLLVGDAAGYLDPLTGEGVRLGLASARAAVSALRAGAPQRYEHAWRRLARSYWLLTDILLRVRRTPGLAGGMLPLLRACPWLFRLGVDALAGEGLEARQGKGLRTISTAR